MPDKSDLLNLKKQTKKHRRDALSRAAFSLVCYVCLFIHHIILLFAPIMLFVFWSLKDNENIFAIIFGLFAVCGLFWNIAFLLNDTDCHFRDRKSKYDEICKEIVSYNKDIKKANDLLKIM